MLSEPAWILAENASLSGQAEGLAEAAGIAAESRRLRALGWWAHLAPSLWPWPLRAIDSAALAGAMPGLVIGSGGKAAAVLAALRTGRRGRTRTVIVQHPRMRADRFDLVVVADHDGLRGPNVLSTRTALHRMSPARLAAAAAVWGPRFAHLPRPLVSVLVGGNNGRFRLEAAEAEALAAGLAGMMRADGVGLVLTPSRRTGPVAWGVLERVLRPLGAWLWDGTGENPYAGMLACADAIVVTNDSVSFLSEAVATRAPVLLAGLPGYSQRIGAFNRALLASGRVRAFAGRLETWPVTPIDDMAEVAGELRRRLGL